MDHNNMLNESSSSFDTMPSFDMNPGEERDGIVSEDDNENYDGDGYRLVEAVVSEGGSGGGGSAVQVEEEEGGILILPPVVVGNNSVASSSSSRQSDFDLSVPDSVPSELNSILHLPNPVLVHEFPSSSCAGEEGSEGDAEFLLLDGSTTNYEEHSSSSHTAGRRTVEVLGDDDTPSCAAATAQRRRHNLLVFVVVVSVVMATATFGSVAVVRLVRERRQLKEQLRDLQALEQAYLESLSAAAALAKKQELLQKEADADAARQKEAEEKANQHSKESKAGFTFPWDETKDDDGSCTLIDNCWLHAQFKMELGQCSREAANTVKKHVQSLGNYLLDANDRVWDYVQGDYQDMKNWFYAQEQQQGQSKTESKECARVTTETVMTVMKPVQSFGNYMSDANERFWHVLRGDYQAINERFFPQQHGQPKSESGEGARATTETVKKPVQSFGNVMYEAHNRILDQLRGDYQEMKAQFYPQQPKFQPSSSTASSQSGETNKNSTKMEQQKSKTDLLSVAKTVLTTAALGTAAAILFSAVDWFGKNDD